MFSITDHVPLKFTCAVCGKLLNDLAPGFPDLTGSTCRCKKCGHPVCAEHYDRKANACHSCSGKKSDWCTTPPAI